MRRVQLNPASGNNNPGKKEEATTRGVSRSGILAGGKPVKPTSSSFAAASSLFNVPAKRRGDNVDVTHGSTNTASPPTIVSRQHLLSDAAQEEQGAGCQKDGEAPAAKVVCEVNEEAEAHDLTGAVATVKDICEALDADTIGPAEADARLNSLSTVALLAAAPFGDPRDREAVFEVAHDFVFFPCSFFS